MMNIFSLMMFLQDSIADRSVQWPTWEAWRRVLLLEDYNTRIVVLGTALLGCAAGMVGGFTLLRKRALMGDALSHATLPGIALAFIIATRFGWDAKSLPVLLFGATISGLIGVGTILAIRKLTRLKEDAALGIVLSVFFGAGIALIGVVQQMEGGHSAGLESFIFGKTASMGSSDIKLIAWAAIFCIALCLLLYKELKLLCFDDGFAASRGFPVTFLDLSLMSTVVLISIVGLQAVGLVLMIALLIIPPAAARFWTESMAKMLLISAMIGTVAGLIGAAASALFPRLPSGAMIVLACTICFVFSLVFGRTRGVLTRWFRRRHLNRSVAIQHLLRAMYELAEISDESQNKLVSLDHLLEKRSWSLGQLNRAISMAENDSLVSRLPNGITLTPHGRIEAKRMTREHRLWELYLIAYAEIAPSRVDREADHIEHVLEPAIVAELEAMLEQSGQSLPLCPHDQAGELLQGGKINE